MITLERLGSPSKSVPQALIDSRINCCKGCKDYSEEADKCRLCGCSGVMKDRTRSRFATCPAGKW